MNYQMNKLGYFSLFNFFAIFFIILVPGLSGAVFEIQDETVTTVAEDFEIPIFFSHDDNVRGVTVVMDYDPDVFNVDDVTFSEGLSPEWSAIHIEEHWVSFGWILDFTSPYEDQVLAAGDNQEIGRLQCSLKQDLQPGEHPLTLPEDGRGEDPLLRNSYVIGIYPVYPDLVDGVLTITWPQIVIESVTAEIVSGNKRLTITGTGFIEGVTVFNVGGEIYEPESISYREAVITVPPCTEGESQILEVCNGSSCDTSEIQCGTMFIRGDANTDGNMDIADPIRILGYLFSNKVLTCFDSADSNDDGSIDLADGIYLLQMLFSEGDTPPAPYPEAGLDPTPDELDCEEYNL